MYYCAMSAHVTGVHCRVSCTPQEYCKHERQVGELHMVRTRRERKNGSQWDQNQQPLAG